MYDPYEKAARAICRGLKIPEDEFWIIPDGESPMAFAHTSWASKSGPKQQTWKFFIPAARAVLGPLCPCCGAAEWAPNPLYDDHKNPATGDSAMKAEALITLIREIFSAGGVCRP